MASTRRRQDRVRPSRCRRKPRLPKYQQEKPKKIAKKAAQARHENSDHAKAKTEIKEKWLKQRVTIIASRGKAQFCRDMQNKYKDKDGNDLIKDTKTILTWIKNWEAELLQK